MNARLSQGFMIIAMVAIVAGCRSNKADNNSELDFLSSDKNAENVALFLGMPAGDAWISNNLWPVRDAVALDPGFKGSVTSYDNVGRSAALSEIAKAASKVSPDGTLFLMLAGHGAPNGLIQTHDRGFMNSSDVGAAIAAARKGKGRFKRLILVVFSCYSGNWVNGYTPLRDSDAFARVDSIDRQLYSMSSSIADQATLELASGLSKSKGIYEQMLVVSSQVYSQLSWGSYFGSTFGNGYRRLRAENPNATIGDLMRYISRQTPMNQPQYRASPEYEVLNDYLFRADPSSARVDVQLDTASEKRLTIKVDTRSNIYALVVCQETDQRKCKATSKKTLRLGEAQPEPNSVQFLLNDSSLLTPRSHILTLGFRDLSTKFPSGGNATEDAQLPLVDMDGDAVEDDEDECPDTPPQIAVFKMGPYIGCSGEQTPVRRAIEAKMDTAKPRPLLAVRSTLYFDGEKLFVDNDADKVDDAVDFCFPTPRKAKVIRTGLYAGCTPSQAAQRAAMVNQFAPKKKLSEGAGVDSDGDGIQDKYDRCDKTAKGTAVHKSGYWMGCGSGDPVTP